MAGLVQQRGDLSTRVSGTGRPGAKLLAVTAGRPPPPGSCCVLFAGTHDVAAGETHGILKRGRPSWKKCNLYRVSLAQRPILQTYRGSINPLVRWPNYPICFISVNFK
ncbi:hypothetical protein J6590_030405 [Homalodisca vitripennis]|nr:hypothetical protein J6590_030405 [Homalodisca vitripennis]